MGSRASTRTIALVVAAVLGIALGVAAAFESTEDPTSVAQDGEPGADDTPSWPADFDDPLKLGRPLTNVTCDGSTLLIVGWGNKAPALAPSMSTFPTAQYLDTSESCRTAYPTIGGKVARYAAYLPPFPTATAACTARMTPEQKGNFATRMVEDNRIPVQCGCEIGLASMPELSEAMPQTTLGGMWVKSYQNMLADVGLLDRSEVTGLFTRKTVHVTYRIQTGAAVNPSGIVDQGTWNIIRNKACRRYDY